MPDAEEGDVHLRAVERRDLPRTRIARADRRVWATALGRRFPTTEHGEEQWFESLGSGRFPTDVVWAIATGPASEFGGLVVLSQIDWVDRTAEFGLWVEPEQQRSGLGRAATDLALAHAGGALNLRRLRLRVLADHTAARELYRSVGFVEEGLLVGDTVLDGVERDLVLMAVRLESAP